MPQQPPELNGALAQGVSTKAATTEEIGDVIGRIHRELQLLLLERAAIVKRIGVIRHTIVGLADVFGADVIDQGLQYLLLPSAGRRTRGLTDVCRRMLMKFSQPLTTRQLCDRIQETDPSVLTRQKCPTTSVGVVLRRLVNYGQVQDGLSEDGRTWLWIGARQRDDFAEHSSSSPLKREQASNETMPIETKV
jgi:hypothetical protein